MMYVQDISCISPQNTFEGIPFQDGTILHTGSQYKAIEPNYLEFIPKGKLRRMGKVSKLGITAGVPIINRNENIDGIIIGTGNGGLNDCVKFLDQIITYAEGSLTPTNFVQSTANAVSGTLALMSSNTNYNSTYVSVGLAFEFALLDALMQIEDGSGLKFLVGNAEEISEYNHNINEKRGFFKTPPVSAAQLIDSNTKGSISGEGSAMFAVSNESQNALACIMDVGMIHTSSFEDVHEAIISFLNKNNIDSTEIGSLILGFNGDVIADSFYHQLLKSQFTNQRIISFKNLVGEYPSVSGFALWLACLPNPILQEAIYKEGTNLGKYTLIYNHYQGESHGFILISK